MPNEDAPIAQYVRKVNEETRRFAQSLLAENERLRGAVPALQQERDQALAEAKRMREDLERQAAERARLRELVAETEAEGQRFSAQYLAVEQQNFNLLNLYVASYRLHGTLQRSEVLDTVREIVANLIGCEEMAVFLRGPGTQALHLVAATGIDQTRFRTVRLGKGIIGGVALSGRAFLAGEPGGAAAEGNESDLTACVPLKVEESVTGAIAIFRLLRQKVALEAIDRDLLELLGTHAAMALYCTGLHERFGLAAETQA